MRRRLGALGALAVLVVVAAGFVAGPAGAQTQAVFSCTYTVGPTQLPPGGGNVTVQGTAPGSSVVRIFVNGVLNQTVPSAPVTGAFSATIFITGSVELSVALDDYPSTPCIGVGGNEVNGGTTGGGANGTGVNAAGLAHTGSSGTKPIVLVGLAALSLGLVLVVAGRRRITVHGRD
jgi:LPXTG-motif cell wall-anchored protein